MWIHKLFTQAISNNNKKNNQENTYNSIRELERVNVAHCFEINNKAPIKHMAEISDPKMKDSVLKEFPATKMGTKTAPINNLEISNKYSEILSNCESDNVGNENFIQDNDTTMANELSN